MVVCLFLPVGCHDDRGANEKTEESEEKKGQPPCVLKEDFNADGIIERTLTYNDEGAIEKEETDDDYVPKRIVLYTYNDEGALLSEEVSEDGESTSLKTNSYDDGGHLLFSETTYHEDNVSSSVEYTYDEDGRVLTSASMSENGIPDGEDVYTYDEEGRVLTHYRRWGEHDSSSTWDTYTYDKEGNLLSELNRSDIFDEYEKELTTRTYDSDNNLLTTEHDHGADGTVETRETYTRDAKGRVLTFLRESSTAEGVSYVRLKTCVYDSTGYQCVTEETELGETEPSLVRTAIYNVDGKLIEVDEDNDSDGVIDSRETNTYDSEGHRLTQRIDDDGDGTTDFQETNTYDSEGHRLTQRIDDDGDGTTDSGFTDTYDSDGNLLSRDEEREDGRRSSCINTIGSHGTWAVREVDSNGDGTIDIRKTMEGEACSLVAPPPVASCH